MKRLLSATIGICLLTFFLSNCMVAGAQDRHEMLVKASELTKLTAAVESYVRYKHPPEGIDDQELLRLATQHDASILERFAGYIVRVQWKNRHAIVLVCTPDGSQGLLEDAGCTSEFDQHLWQSIHALPCNFTMTIENVCGK